MAVKGPAKPPESAGLSGLPRRLWRARAAIWTMVIRDLDYMRDFWRPALAILATMMVVAYILAYVVFSGSGDESTLFDGWLPGRVSNIFYMITTVSVFVAALAFGMAFTAQRMNGTMKNYFNHPVGVVEVVAAKLAHVFILGMTLVLTMVVAPIIPFVQAGLLSPGAGAALAATAVLAFLATYVSLIFGVAMRFCVQERISRFRPELPTAACIALFLVLTKNFLSRIGLFIVQARADSAGTAVTQADLDAVEAASVWLSALSPFEVALNLGQAAFANPSFLWGLLVAVPIVGAVFFVGLARAARVYPEAMW